MREFLNQDIDYGNTSLRGEKGHGPVILTINKAKLLRPSITNMESCLGLCQIVRLLSLKKLLIIKYHKKDIVDQGRRGVCLSQRSCPIYQHHPDERKNLPCTTVREELQDFLGQQ